MCLKGLKDCEGVSKINLLLLLLLLALNFSVMGLAGTFAVTEDMVEISTLIIDTRILSCIS